ncbi:hypothetical protein C1752_00120 [Acaryochloris thomasi RCC1774]|uniref:Uncharacterized protein n=1 Tax=Acaryochloris thomasi RCC1774 TaxID=1764569 RepID=A0A2W1K6P5_9CYAN|nr:hypothetical protein [Acaryochloris thomasi]PZD75267.1 hypothetical protein C1752_00120 [Acaryochloris thomasi RCC1774]
MPTSNQTPILQGLLISLLLAPLLLLNSCGATEQEAPPSTEAAAQPDQLSTGEPTTVKASVKFKQDGGQERFTLKYKPDGAKLEDAAGAEIARLNIDAAQKVKIKDPQDQVLGYVVPTTGAWKLENAEQSEELYILRQQDDGDYKLETGSDQPIYRIKKREYGYEIESPDKQSLYKVKEKEGKISLRNAEDQTVLYSKDKTSPIAMACFGFEVLTPEQQAALAYAVSQSTP